MRNLNRLEEIGAKYLKLERLERLAPDSDELSDACSELGGATYNFSVENDTDDYGLSAERLQRAIDTFGREAPPVEVIDLGAPGGAERLNEVIAALESRDTAPTHIID